MKDVIASARHVRALWMWDSGGGVELDVVELEDGVTLVVGDETVAVYRSADDFRAEAGDGGEGRRRATLLRATGLPLELAAAR